MRASGDSLSRNRGTNRAASATARDAWVALAPALFVLMWSTGFIGAKLGAPYAEPFTFLTVRFGIATLLFALWGVIARAEWPGPRDVAHSLVVGVLVHGLYLCCVFWAIAHGMSAGVTALIIGLQPLMTAILAGLFLGEELTARHWIGLALGLAGLALVLAPRIDLAGSGITPLSVGVVVAAVLSITLGTLYQKRFSVTGELRTGVAWQFFSGTAVCAIAAWFAGWGTIMWSGEFIFALAWLVVVLSFGAVMMLMVLIRRGAVSQVATLFYLVAPVTALIGWAMFGETLEPVQLAGMTVTVIGVALAGRRWRPMQT